MLIKIYGFLWLLLIGAAAGALALVGATETVLTVLGLAFSTLFFGGLVAVLPWHMDRHYSQHMIAERKSRVKKRRRSFRIKRSPANASASDEIPTPVWV